MGINSNSRQINPLFSKTEETPEIIVTFVVLIELAE
jgi:hypothetical protein